MALAERAKLLDLHPDHTRHAGDALNQGSEKVPGLDFASKAYETICHVDLDVVALNGSDVVDDPDDLPADQLVAS